MGGVTLFFAMESIKMATTSVDQVTGYGETVAYKAPCRLATTADITLSGLQTIDGSVTAANDRVLVKNQTTSTQNGIYIASAGAWQRARDMDTNRDLTKGTRLTVIEGSANAGREYYVSTANPITVGTTNLAFTETLSSNAGGSAAAAAASAGAALVSQGAASTSASNAATSASAASTSASGAATSATNAATSATTATTSATTATTSASNASTSATNAGNSAAAAASSASAAAATLAGALPKAGGIMTGALVLNQGAVATPGLSFDTDLNTGLYSPGNNTLGLVTAGTERIAVTAAGSVGVGRTPTINQMEVADTFSVVSTQPRLECVRYNPTPGADGIPGPHIVNKAARGTESLPTALLLGDRLGNFGWRPHDGTSFQDYTVAALKAVAAENFSLAVCGTDVYLTTSAKGTNTEIERWRTSSEGQFLIGTSVARGANPSALLARLQVEGTDVAGASISIIANTNAVTGPTIFLGKSRATVNGGLTIVQSGDTVGTVSFRGLDGATPASVASIAGVVDGTPGAGDMPGRLVFGTTADGAASTTERLRIDSVGFSSFSGSVGRGAPVTKTADFSVAATENWLINNKAAATCTVTLPAAASFTGREITIKNLQAFTVVSASSNVVPLAGGAAATAILAAAAGRWATLVSDGTNWIVMAGA
ncbi:MAG: hypothetical protein EOS12_28590 [Mesorhizobium sp.]|nr:MAG: hypothetical protein EOS12_28590 [Mesorhizobium sp.]